MLAAALRRKQRCAAAAAEKPEGQRHHDKAETAQGVHSEAEHVVGVGEVIQIDDERGARGGQAGDAVEDGIEAVSYTHLDVYKRQLPRLP